MKFPEVSGVGREGQWPAAGSRGKRSWFCAAQTTKQDWFELFICFGFLSYMAEYFSYSLRYKVITMVNYLPAL